MDKTDLQHAYDPNIIHGRVHAPYFIYFRRELDITDDQLLAHFGLTEHRRLCPLKGTWNNVVIAEAGEWTMFADDWHYNLLNMSTTRAEIDALATMTDVFTWWTGDADLAFALTLYRNGQVTREYIVDSPNYNDQIVRLDFGEKLPFEGDLLSSGLDPVEIMHRYTRHLGIEPPTTRETFRTYFKPYRSTLDLRYAITNINLR